MESMITPEFVLDERGEFVFVANHSVASDEQISQSVDYNRACILNARKHLPPHLSVCRLIYDIRGQRPSDEQLDHISVALRDVCTVEFKR